MADLLQGEKQFHLQVTPDQVGKYVILPGDPGRVPRIAAYLDHAEQMRPTGNILLSPVRFTEKR